MQRNFASASINLFESFFLSISTLDPAIVKEELSVLSAVRVLKFGFPITIATILFAYLIPLVIKNNRRHSKRNITYVVAYAAGLLFLLFVLWSLFPNIAIIIKSSTVFDTITNYLPALLLVVILIPIVSLQRMITVVSDNTKRTQQLVASFVAIVTISVIFMLSHMIARAVTSYEKSESVECLLYELAVMPDTVAFSDTKVLMTILITNNQSDPVRIDTRSGLTAHGVCSIFMAAKTEKYDFRLLDWQGRQTDLFVLNPKDSKMLDIEILLASAVPGQGRLQAQAELAKWQKHDAGYQLNFITSQSCRVREDLLLPR